MPLNVDASLDFKSHCTFCRCNFHHFPIKLKLSLLNHHRVKHKRWHSVNIIVICNRFNWKLNIAVDAMQKQEQSPNQNFGVSFVQWCGDSKGKGKNMKHYPPLCDCLAVSLRARKQTTMIMLNGTTAVDDDTTLKHSDALIIWSHSLRRNGTFIIYFPSLFRVLLVFVIFVHFKNNSHGLCLTRHKK